MRRLEALSLLVVLVEVGAAAWALVRGDLTAVVVLNLIGAVGLLAAIVPNLIAFRTIAEEFVQFLIVVGVFELAVLATSLLWFAHRRLAWLAWVEFAGHAVLSLGMALFIFTFKIARLI